MNRGMSLLEVMVSVAILALVSGGLYVLSASVGSAAANQEVIVTMEDEARRAMQVIEREFRNAASSTVNWASLPGPVLQFRAATDVDGNGVAVDQGGNLELSPVQTISRDTNDLNRDGRTLTQLIHNDGVAVHVLCNDLLIDEDTNNNGVLNTGEDTNSNGQLDRGLRFGAVSGGVMVWIQTQRRASPRDPLLKFDLRATIYPRNG